MNTIRRPRRRPRVRSVNFRTLWWLLKREAALCIMQPARARFPNTVIRQQLAGADTFRLRGWVAGYLLADSRRRFYQ